MSQPPQEPRLLDYNSPDAARPARIIGQAMGTAIVTVLAVVGFVFGSIIAIGFVSVATDSGGKVGLALAIVLALTALALIVFLSRRWHTDPAARGRAIGLWIGLGVALLIEGTCFIANR